MTDTTQDVNDQTEVQDTDVDEQTTQTSEQDSQPTGFEALPPETQAEIRKLRRENASYRTKVKSFEDASKSEAEKREQALKDAEDRATAAEQRARNALGRVAAMDAATKAGAISAKAVYASIRDDIEFDDESGEPTNIDALVEKYKADDPALFRTPSADGGKGTPATNQDMNSLIRRAAGRK